MKRDAIEENHCLIQLSPFDVRNFFSFLAPPLGRAIYLVSDGVSCARMVALYLKKTCRSLINFADSLDPDHAWPDRGPNCLTHRW